MLGPKASAHSCALLSASLLLVSSIASATPLDFVPVDDPLQDEIRVLELSGAPLRLPHLGTLPIQVVELSGLDRPLAGPAEIARRRILRSIARDLGPAGVPGTTPRLLQWTNHGDEELDASVGLEGRSTLARDHDPRLDSGSGVHFRCGLRIGRLLAASDIAALHVEGATDYAGRIFQNDASFLTDHSSLSLSGQNQRWVVSLGRDRWHWGPGEEGSLVLSRTSTSFTALGIRLRIEPLRADGMLLNGTLGEASGMQLAAHRLEWQPTENLRVGFSEAVRYRASSWEPLYLIGVIPYSIVQNLLVKDEPDSMARLRNNVLAGFDAAWRVAPGTRLYSEFLIDDVRTNDAEIVSKYGYQAGWEGVGTVFGTAVHWGTEYTRLSRFVYTSYYDRAFVASGTPLGFPTGPDSRRVRVRMTWDPLVSWQVFTIAARTDAGESGLDSSYVPGGPRVSVMSFAGVVETTRQLEAGLRYWPASGIDVEVLGGCVWTRNLEHVEGRRRREPYVALSLRLVR